MGGCETGRGNRIEEKRREEKRGEDEGKEESSEEEGLRGRGEGNKREFPRPTGTRFAGRAAGKEDARRRRGSGALPRDLRGRLCR